MFNISSSEPNFMPLFKKTTLVVVVIVLMFLPLAGHAKTYNASEYLHPVEPAKEHPKLGFVIAKQLQYQHYRQMMLDDKLSSKVFDAYLDSLDPNHSFFTASDIKEFESLRHQIDNNFRRGELKPAFSIFNRYQQRHAERLVYSLNLLENRYEQLDFSRNEELVTDREELPWPANEKELQDLARKQLKNVILSFKLAGKDDNEIKELLIKRYKNQLDRLKQTDNEDAFRVYVNALAESYDPHTQYFSPRVSQNFDIQMSLSLEGIGAMLQAEDGYTKVKRLVPAGPAEKAGQLKAGDRIVGVAQGREGEMVDVMGWRLDDVVQLIRGKKGTTVRLEIIPQKSKDEHKTKVISIVRNTVKLEEQAAQKEILNVKLNGKERKIGVIEIPAFYIDFKGAQSGDPNYRSTTRDVRKLIQELNQQNIDGLVIDLRNNGGGSLQEVNSLVGLFIKSGPTVQIKTTDGRISQLTDDSNSVAYEGPMAVLVNRLSASASEIFAGAIQDYNRGLIIGNQTFGKGTVQALQQLDRGQLKLTHAKFYRISGDSTQNLGVVPDIIFPALYDKEEIGESSLPEALIWDQVSKANYDLNYYPELKALYPALKKKHQKRSAQIPDFQYVQETVARIDENKSKKVVSLNEKKRRQEYKESREKQLQIENRRRTAKGEKPFKNIQELDEEDDILGLNDEALDEDEEKDDDESKALLLESANILVDFIDMSEHKLAKH